MSFFARRSKAIAEIETKRLILRPPRIEDHPAWAQLRRDSRAFLTPWEPTWSRDHLTQRAFRNRVVWAERSIRNDEAWPLFLVRREDGQIVGGLTLSNIRRQPAQAGTLGYWTGEPYIRQGYMAEALSALCDHAFGMLDLSRLEAACLAENTASRHLLERCGFKYEGVAQAYLQINGRWRNHVLYASLRPDRRGRVEEI
ncbi:GNAT family N-acetyltransferase [Rhodobacteraceae bacterium NNCM2]|nr:GNAT family N-acetyltransferase [Coraliihabitans acroporae]